MVALVTPEAEKGWLAPDFNLLGVDGRYCDLQSAKGTSGVVIAFICNHCPYVKAVFNSMVNDAQKLKLVGISFVAINSNDSEQYPEDSYEKMKIVARKNKIIFPYLVDSTQDVAKAYGAVCTPDFFGFNANLQLQYRGRLDASQRDTTQNAKRELLIAMQSVSRTGVFEGIQRPSIGCSIKWK
jgi:peroxiredoxin